MDKITFKAETTGEYLTRNARAFYERNGHVDAPLFINGYVLAETPDSHQVYCRFVGEDTEANRVLAQEIIGKLEADNAKQYTKEEYEKILKKGLASDPDYDYWKLLQDTHPSFYEYHGFYVVHHVWFHELDEMFKDRRKNELPKRIFTSIPALVNLLLVDSLAAQLGLGAYSHGLHKIKGTDGSFKHVVGYLTPQGAVLNEFDDELHRMDACERYRIADEASIGVLINRHGAILYTAASGHEDGLIHTDAAGLLRFANNQVDIDPKDYIQTY